MEKYMWDKISAGIVLYNPDIELLKKNIDAIYGKVKLLILVDNGSDNVEDTSSILPQDVVLIKNDHNNGIAAALNQICAFSYENGFEWALTLDQDSVTPNNLIEEFSKYISIERVGMLAPVMCDRNRGDNYSNSTSTAYTEINECITSGSLINLNVWNEIGQFDEKMFIDGVDFDICYRIIHKDYKILQINNVFLSHEIGKMEKKQFLFWAFYVKNHSAFRKYYIAKNTVYLARKQNDIKKLIKSQLQNLKLLTITLFYEDDKKNKALKIIKGNFDGIRQKKYQ